MSSSAKHSLELPLDSKVSEIRKRINLDTQVLNQLAKANAYQWLWRVLLQLAVVGGMICLSEYTKHVFVYLFSVMIIGARQIGLGSIGLHDGGHHLLCKNRVFNDVIAKLIYCAILGPLFMTFNTNRKGHRVHHQTLNTNDDPDLLFFRNVYSYPNWLFLSLMALFLSGVVMIYLIFRYIIKHFSDAKWSVIALAIVIVASVVGTYYHKWLPSLIFYYWIVPLSTWGMFINFIRIMAEHYPKDVFPNKPIRPRVFYTRETLLSPFDRLFVVTCHINFHLAHHLYPEVPFYRLSQLQAILSKNAVYQRYADVTYGYHRVIKEYLFNRRLNDRQELIPLLMAISSMPSSLYEQY